jgi:peptidoglycan/LPS O-acetylase OafA/YrhL
VSVATIAGSRTRGRVAYLDGMRGIAILAVVAVHWGTSFGGVAGGGYIGVDVFFVISGYVITGVLLSRPTTYGRFVRRRARRLLPALAGVLVGGVALAVVVPATAIPADEVARVALVAALQGGSVFIPLTGNLMSPFTVTWSLSAEWVFYLAWPLAVAALARRGTAYGAAAKVVGLVAAALYLASLTLSPSWFYFGPPARFAELLTGCAIAYHLRDRGDGPRRGVPEAWLGVAAAGCCAWVLIGVDPLSPLYRFAGLPLTVAFAAGLVVHGHDRPGSTTTRILGGRLLAGTGVVSYSVYLWHLVPLHLFPAHVFPFPKPLVAVVEFPVVVLLVAACYLLLERPFTGSHAGAHKRRKEPVAAVAGSRPIGRTDHPGMSDTVSGSHLPRPRSPPS